MFVDVFDSIDAERDARLSGMASSLVVSAHNIVTYDTAQFSHGEPSHTNKPDPWQCACAITQARVIITSPLRYDKCLFICEVIRA